VEHSVTSRISVPARAVLEAKTDAIDLVSPGRCSRCDAASARQFETFALRYEAGKVRYHQFTQKFRSTKRIRVRLPLCELCYAANFIENPDSCEHDLTDLGRVAHRRSIGILISSVVTGAAFILLMKVIPLPKVGWLQSLWLMLVGLALVSFAITFGLTERKNRQLRRRLTEAHYDERLHRADVFAKMQLEDPQPEDEAIVIRLENDQWAEECAGHYGWTVEKIKNKENDLEAS
jgi:hypothetical protein